MKKLSLKFIAAVLVFVSFGGFFLFKPARAQNEAQTYGDSEVPVILARSTWDNTPSLNALMTWPPSTFETPSDWQPVERIIIHHTVTQNNDTDPIARIQSIYRYHSQTKGWGDIGYNYIIDQQGNIYEGRYGGNGSRGAHVFRDENGGDNFNYGSIGIALLGDYSAQDINQQMYDSLSRLVGWLGAINNLDPLKITAISIWNKNSGAFNSIFTGNTVLGHKNIDNTTCPGIVNLDKVRQAAAAFKLKYDSYIYQSNASSRVYAIKSGTRKAFASLADFISLGGVYSRAISVSQTQLDLFSETRFLKYSDGSLLQINGDPKIYLIDGGKKRPLEMTAAQFIKLGFDFNKVKNISVDELVNYFDGTQIKYGVETELLSDGNRVYLMQGGRKHWVTSSGLFNRLGLKWSKVRQVVVSEMESFLEGDILKYPDGTLLRDVSQETVYLTKAGQKHRFISAQSFLQFGNKWGEIILTDSQEISLYPEGSFVAYKNGTLVKMKTSPAVYQIEGVKIRPIISAEIFQNLKFSWNQILTINEKELAAYIKSESVKYAEGLLLRPKNENTVYLISGGVPQPIDAVTFKARKYKWSQVLVISQTDFDNLYRPGQTTTISFSSASPTPTPIPSPTSTQIPSSSPSVSPNPSTGEAGASANPKMRVAIYEVTAPGVTLTVNTAFDILNKARQVIVSKNANESFVYNYIAPNEAYAKIVPRSANGIVEIISYEDHPAWKPTLNYNQFHGSVEIVYSVKSNKVWAVNELLLEDYLKGIAEISQTDAAEYQKAMIVAARTYAYYYILKGGKRATDEVYYLNNTSSDQLYKGYAREILAPTIVNAANITYGEVAMFNNQPIIAAYSSGAAELQINGTKSACSVWRNAFCQAGYEYLAGGAKDPAGAVYSLASCLGGNHCVGLSGAGARQFANSGAKNYQEILKYYYLGIDIKKVY